MQDYCKYPNLCGIGTDCSECMSGEIDRLRAELENAMAASESWRRRADKAEARVKELENEIRRLQAEVEQRDRTIDAVWEAVGSDLMGDSLSASVVSIKEDRAKAEARVRELEEALRYCRGRLVYHGRVSAIRRIDIALDNSEKED